MSIRDMLLNALIATGLAFMILFVAAADSLPMWLLAIFAMIVWAVYLVMVIRDHQRDIKYPVVRYRPTDPPIRTIKPPQTTVYDQKEDIR